MRPEEIAAYVGAAAWLPHLIQWGYHYFAKPLLTISLGRKIEIGFTQLGPILNIQMAFCVENKDMIVDEIKIDIQHQEGERRCFTWYGLGENVSEITDNLGNKQTVRKDQKEPIAIKVSKDGLIEKSVRFQDPRYHREIQIQMGELKDQARYILQKQIEPEVAISELFSSKQYLQACEGRRQHFWWKAGGYSVRVGVQSKKSFLQDEAEFRFDLTQNDINLLQANCALVEAAVKNDLGKGLPDYEPIPTKWRWVYVEKI